MVNLTKPFCWLYVFDGGRRGVKVGIATQGGLCHRLRACRAHSGHRGREFAKLWHLERFAYEVESTVKDSFSDRRIHGEWFRVSLGDMLKEVERTADVYMRRAEYDKGLNAA